MPSTLCDTHVLSRCAPLNHAACEHPSIMPPYAIIQETSIPFRVHRGRLTHLRTEGTQRRERLSPACEHPSPLVPHLLGIVGGLILRRGQVVNLDRIGHVVDAAVRVIEPVQELLQQGGDREVPSTALSLRPEPCQDQESQQNTTACAKAGIVATAYEHTQEVAAVSIVR